MIVTLSGIVTEKLETLVVIEAGGVGYGLNMTLDDQTNVTTGQAAKVYIYEHIREQTYDLFGFLTRDTKSLFEQLLAVNGVGPKMALSVLSIGTTGNVRRAIAGGDLKTIQAANGVGKRVAERIVVDLKDKVGLASIDIEASGLLHGDNALLQDEAVEGLVSLGYSAYDAALVLKDINRELPSEERIKRALQGKR